MPTKRTAKERKRVILIAGMHRSGTSMLARLLNLHGAYLPLEMHYTDSFNERGYWESFEVQHLNEKLLQLGDSAWHDTRAFSVGRQREDVVESAIQAIQQFCTRLLNQDASTFVIKDPRICRLLPYWRRALNALDAEVSVLIPYRSPLEVAASIGHRDGFRVDHCAELWLRNLLDAELDSRDLRRALFSYGEMLGDWAAVYCRICSTLSLDDLQPAEAIADQLAEFMSDSLRHWQADDSELAERLGCQSLVTRAFLALESGATADDAEFRADMDKIRTEYESGPEPGLLTRDREALTELGQFLEAEQSNNIRLKENVAALMREKELLQAKSRHLQMEVEELLPHAKRADQLGQDNATLTGELQQLQKERAELMQTIDGLLGSLTWRLTAPARCAVDWLVLRPAGLVASLANRSIEAIWRLLPGSEDAKRAAKRGIFTTFRFPLKYTRFYREWVDFEEQLANQVPGPSSPSARSLIRDEAAARCFVARQTFAEPPPQPAKLIAFYLPQFHPIPENDRWWGTGFTEWTNVRKAAPLFEGHCQPRVPIDLGYYDLRDVEVQRQQVALAKDYGIGGFCFYFYWFHGERLLEAPVLQYLDNPDLDLPFCLCWANENWTRTWDGLDSEVLISQEHSKHDDLAFIEHVARYLRDPRYIRVDGKPLLLVYRPSLLPNMAATARRWRKWCREHGLGEIYLAYPQSFEKVDHEVYGFDAAIEFPPNNTGPTIVTDQVSTLVDEFSGFVYDWTSIADRSDAYEAPQYTLFRGVNPSWDNAARRGNTGAVFIGQTPWRYFNWLRNAIADTVSRFEEPSERLVFINAWNEWAEGAYLEPDAAYGYAWLQATRDALVANAGCSGNRRIILVAHDAHPHGAQYLMLYTARCLKQYFKYDVDLVVLGEGILLEEFRNWATVHSMANVDHQGQKARALADDLARQGHTAAICNTTVSGLFLETLSDAGLRCISLVHELSNVIHDNHLEAHARSIAQHADTVVFAATQVMEPFLEIAGVPRDKTLIRFQGNYKKNAWVGDRAEAGKRLRRVLELPDSAKIVLGAGFLDYRKGVDLFVKAGMEVCHARPDVFFVWIGHWEINMKDRIHSMLDEHELEHRFIFPGRQDDTDLFFAGADVFALTSREDPFPTTVMEALEVATPVLGFAGAGGSETLIRKGCGSIVPMGDTAALAASIIELLENPDLHEKLGQKGAQIVREDFSFPHYVFDLLKLAGKPMPRVSVIVPNYNYERHLEQRLRSIFEQTFPIYELIVLDDASTDESIRLIERLLGETEIHSKLIVNDSNSGSVFRQWAKGVEMAKGDLIWICEADDFAAPEFLTSTVAKMEDDSIVISYTQSSQVDEQGKVIDEDYIKYTDDVSTEKWRADYIADGMEELSTALAVKNTIPNVSAVLFRKAPLHQVLSAQMSELQNLRVAGDWLIYAELLMRGKIAFTASPLNFHRRHDESVTISKRNNEQHFAEILFMQSWVANKVNLNVSAQARAQQFANHARRYLKIAPRPNTEILRQPVSKR